MWWPKAVDSERLLIWPGLFFNNKCSAYLLWNKILQHAKKHFQFSREWSLLSDVSHMDKSGCFCKKASKVRVPRQLSLSLSFIWQGLQLSLCTHSVVAHCRLWHASVAFCPLTVPLPCAPLLSTLAQQTSQRRAASLFTFDGRGNWVRDIPQQKQEYNLVLHTKSWLAGRQSSWRCMAMSPW